MAINRRGTKYILDWWADGRRFRKFFDTKKAAEAHQTNIRKKQLDGAYVAPDKVPLFREAAEAWLSTRANRSEASYDQYAIRVKYHLIPRFGDLRLDQITHEMIAAWRAQLAQSGGRGHRPLAANSISAIVGALSGILDSTVRSGRLAGNPVKQLERDYSRAREGHREDAAVRPDEIFSADEIRRLIAATKPGLYRTLFMLAAATGAREGELFALKWGDIDFEQQRISIRRSLSWAKGPLGTKNLPRFGPPKTKAGVRDLHIDAPVALALKQWKLKAGRNDMDLIFLHPDGLPLRGPNMVTYEFRPILKRAGISYRKFHALRHSYASGLIAHGAPITEVQHRLGHSNQAITLSVYSHWLKDADSGAASAYSAELFAIDTK